MSTHGRHRKLNLYGDDSSQSQSSTGDLGDFSGVEGQRGKIIYVREVSLTLVSFTHLILVCGSAYENGCVVDGMYATAAD